MPRRPAVITQADVARAVRAAKQAGAFAVEVAPDGRIVIRLTADVQSGEHEAPPLAPKGEILL